MHVTRVELENIKGHKRAEFNFARGTTAITGENGAGKTTILESIAWALFDTLDYSKDDFLRRGAKRGSVRVTFESDVDGRPYTVYRDTGQGYYIFDHALNAKIADRKADVSAKLRQLLGIEPGTDVQALFKSAIGVPQGTFTSDFLRAAAQRKAAFDRLLKVEEYREGAERLRETVNLINARTAEVRERIASAEGQLARYDELIFEHKETAARTHELTSEFTALQQEIERRAAHAAQLDEAEQRVNETRARYERLNVERDASARRAHDLKELLDAALEACRRAQAAEEDHKAHLAALEQLIKLEAERVARDQLRAEVESNARLVLSAQSDLQRLEEALNRATQAAITILALETDINRQEELERERERLRDLRAEAISARNRLTRLDAELEVLRKQHAQTHARVKEAQSGEGASERVEALANERLGVETLLSQTEKASTSRKHLLDQRKMIEREINILRREITSLEKELTALQVFSGKASEVAQWLARDNDLGERLAHLRAELKRDETMRAQVKNGLCPILSERCLNMGEGQTLEDYFKVQLATNQAQIVSLQGERARINAELHEAREAEKHFAQFESKQMQLSNEQRRLREQEEMLAQIDRELAKLIDANPRRLEELKIKLGALDLELKPTRDAALRYAELLPLKQRLQEIELQGKQKKDERAGLAAAAEAIITLEQELTDAEIQLRALNDPRGRVLSLREEAARADALKPEVVKAKDALRARVAQAGVITEQLEKYREVELRLEAARSERARTLPAHHEFLASQSLAATLPARQADFEAAETEAMRLTQEAQSARDEYERAQNAYNREEHTRARLELAGARERAAALDAQLTVMRERETALTAELARLEKVRADMRDEFRAKERLENLNETTDFIRDILKQAGPLVTESYLYNISIEANQLFREITNEPGRALKWSRDYEIILEEEGHERSFQNLSGGEQMAAALSVRLALLKQLSDVRLAFFDEPTVNMDARRRESLAQQIGQISHFDQLFVISHDDTFEESVDHIVHIKKDEDGTRQA